ncbi:uncharacterized protein METZ01_LOCUS470315 [marine metagenome]|uniref:Uncharacterized protein n=1 Tax=marine metagenome TaxID=408172 RepID=A0A383BCA4_9ZZZZ
MPGFTHQALTTSSGVLGVACVTDSLTVEDSLLNAFILWL